MGLAAFLFALRGRVAIGRSAPHNLQATVSSERWFVSSLIIIHLLAISAASLPDPRELGLARPAAATPPVDAIARVATPAVNALAAALTPIEAQAYRLTIPIRALTGIYIQAGLRQRWNMFANPETADQYVRVAHYVRSSRESGRVHVFRELALPAQREDRLRATHAFRDKAILNSLEALAVDRFEHPGVDHYSDLAPVAEYFERRFRATYLSPDEVVSRTEVWFGAAPMPPSGQRLSDAQLEERWAVLQRYRDGPVDVPATTPQQPGALEGESDVVWRLEYVQSR